MAEGLGSAANLAIRSGKALYEKISTINDAPDTLNYLMKDIQALSNTIHTFKARTSNDADADQSYLREVVPVLNACRESCEAFKHTIDDMFRYSKPGEVGWKDRFRLCFREKDIAAFQSRLSSYKKTLSISIDVATYQMQSDGIEATKALESKFNKVNEAATNLITQVHGLQIGMQPARDTDTASSNESATALSPQQPTSPVRVEVQQSEVRQTVTEQHCHKACSAISNTETKASGHEYKSIKTGNKVKAIIGDIGVEHSGVSHKYEDMDLDGGWVVAGNVDGNFVKDFFRD